MQTLVVITIVLTAVLGASGREIPSRIIGGSDAPDGKYPYQVSLMRYGGAHYCGGSIIHKRWILTAGHCIFESRLSHMKIGTNVLSEEGLQYTPYRKFPHPKYDSINLVNDIGLIQINRDMEFNEKVQPIRLPDRDFTKVDYPATVSGWGSTTDGFPDHLQHINLTVISQESCRDVHSVTESHICTLTKVNEGTCFGDSGSPLTADGVQIGIVSFGRPCARGYPDVYTRVWTFMDWIQETIEQNS